MPTSAQGKGTHYDRVLTDFDERQRAIDLSTWNLTPPETGIFDEPRKCYTINDQWAKIVFGLISWLATPAPWASAENDGYSACEEILRFMMGGSCMSQFQLRQNDENLCILEQSTDGGNTWSFAFDYSLCLNIDGINDRINELAELLQSLIDTYDETIPSIAPDMVYDATATDDIRDIALCRACHDIVDAICEAELQRRNEIALAAALTGVVAGIVAAIIVIFSAGSGTAAALALASALAGGFATVFDGVNEAVLTDSDARSLVACCMYNALKGATITKAGFEGSLDSCAFTELTPEAQIAGAISSLLEADNMFITFVDLMQQTYKLAELGVVDCPCDIEGQWEVEWDFTVDSGASDGWQHLTWGNGWVSGKGWESQDYQGIQEINYIQNMYGTDATITYVEVERWTPDAVTNFEDSPPTTYLFQMRLRDDGVNVGSYSESAELVPIDKTIVTFDDPVGVVADYLFFTSNPRLTGGYKWYYKRVVVRGTGVNPFA